MIRLALFLFVLASCAPAHRFPLRPHVAECVEAGRTLTRTPAGVVCGGRRSR